MTLTPGDHRIFYLSMARGATDCGFFFFMWFEGGGGHCYGIPGIRRWQTDKTRPRQVASFFFFLMVYISRSAFVWIFMAVERLA